MKDRYTTLPHEGMTAIPAVQFPVTPEPDAIEMVPAWLSKLFEPISE